MHLLLPCLKTYGIFLVSIMLLPNSYVYYFVLWFLTISLLISIFNESNKPIPTPTIEENEEMIRLVREQIHSRRQLQREKRYLDEQNAKIEREQLLNNFENLMDEVEMRKAMKNELELQLKDEQAREVEQMEKLKLEQHKMELDKFEQLQRELEQRNANELQLKQELEKEKNKQLELKEKENNEKHQQELNRLCNMLVEISELKK